VELYLVRHAVAYPHDADRWPDDTRRPLTPQGEEVFREAARGLRLLAPSVRSMLSSPYPRAWRTAEVLHEEAGWPEPVAAPGLEKERTPAEMLEDVEGRLDHGSLAVVGHEPALTELASTLLAGDTRLRIDLDKGGAMAMALEVASASKPRRAELRWLVTQRVLRSLAR